MARKVASMSFRPRRDVGSMSGARQSILESIKWAVQVRRAAITVRHHVYFDSGVFLATRLCYGLWFAGHQAWRASVCVPPFCGCSRMQFLEKERTRTTQYRVSRCAFRRSPLPKLLCKALASALLLAGRFFFRCSWVLANLARRGRVYDQFTIMHGPPENPSRSRLAGNIRRVRGRLR